ncbi:MAG: glutamine--tRNA ligase/YqeY domain fusion protein [Candidatus Neomarinimicrobiota bacterium]
MIDKSNTLDKNFIQKIIDLDLDTNKWEGRVHTRFPPEPNGYLHIGHAKSICLNFGLAEQYGGKCNLRFDDTNPLKEETEYVESIIEDVKWLGYQWSGDPLFASDYFDQMHDYALKLIKNGKAYVCDQNLDEIRKFRGTLTNPGKDSPYRTRSTEENFGLFERMKNGKFKNGEKTLRAKIDMSHPNLNMRDPVLYRILHVKHHRTGSKWCIYPMYDWAHGLEDSIEKITHSICTLEFEDHRPLYDWYINQLEVYHPQQIEFARLNINFTVLSKRKLKKLVDEKHVDGWDDPRMPTISGLRRRGYTPSAIRSFSNSVGVTKRNSIIDVVRLENSLREELNKTANRVLAVVDPIKIIITNYPENKIEMIEAVNNPENPNSGTRKIPFSREIYIEKDDFMENPPRKFFRLSIGKEVRLRYAYFITCVDIIKNSKNEIKEIHCTYDPNSFGGKASDGRKVKGTLHWVSVNHAKDAEVRLYDRLFEKENPEKEEDFTNALNPNSCKIFSSSKLEPSMENLDDLTYQFERLGYFRKDSNLEHGDKSVYIRVVSLRDSWAKMLKK